MQPVVTLAPDGQSGRARWHIMAMLGGYERSASWSGGVYENQYVRENGVWKFSHRAIVADWAYPATPSAVRLDHPFLAGAHIGTPGPADPSYKFFSLLRRGER